MCTSKSSLALRTAPLAFKPKEERIFFWETLFLISPPLSLKCPSFGKHWKEFKRQQPSRDWVVIPKWSCESLTLEGFVFNHTFLISLKLNTFGTKQLKDCSVDEVIILCSRCLVDPSPEMNIKGKYLHSARLHDLHSARFARFELSPIAAKLISQLDDKFCNFTQNQGFVLLTVWQMRSIAFPFVGQMRILGLHFPKSMGWFWTFFFTSSVFT